MNQTPEIPTRRKARWLVLAALCAWGSAAGQSVSMTGAMGGRALLVIDGKPVTAVAGSTVHGVKVVSVESDAVVVEFGGQRQTVRLGAVPVHLADEAAVERDAGVIVLTAGYGGHFQTLGAINGRTVTLMVDTGATTVSMSTADARRIGLPYEKGQPVTLQTANGVIQGWRVNLASVRIGEVEVYDVEGVVAERDMPFVLLGNSFLNRFMMRRENDRMTLERRF